ncbi:Lrp/AsnC family transcriptional regulator, partial [Xenophilus azovorans]|uniref:Lrp/AsnC family transcriptional regulator n=1 Tax=Xenophilus azovorans TaxID=151755 RepID=UPI0012ED3D14
MINLDDTDRQLIALLRDNARATVASLAQRLRVARGTVQNRIARLEREGVIAGYTVRLKRKRSINHTLARGAGAGADPRSALYGSPSAMF